MCAATSSTGCGGRARRRRVDLVLYFFFFFPGVTALIFAGWKYASRSWGYGEVSASNSPAGIPIYQFKTVIVAAGILLFIQGIAQVFRCIICMRDRRVAAAATTTSRRPRPS